MPLPGLGNSMYIAPINTAPHLHIHQLIILANESG